MVRLSETALLSTQHVGTFLGRSRPFSAFFFGVNFYGDDEGDGSIDGDNDGAFY